MDNKICLVVAGVLLVCLYLNMNKITEKKECNCD